MISDMIDPATLQIIAVAGCAFIAIVTAFLAMYLGSGW